MKDTTALALFLSILSLFAIRSLKPITSTPTETCVDIVKNLENVGNRPIGSRKSHEATRLVWNSINNVMLQIPNIESVEKSDNNSLYTIPWKSNIVELSIRLKEFSGSHSLQTRSTLIRQYSNIPVIQVHLKPENCRDCQCLALFAHYDSHVTSLGIIDDASGIATLISTLEQLILAKVDLLHPLCIFLAGAEEPGLDSSHAILSSTKDIAAFINVESAGNQGLAALYRANSPSLVRHYAKSVPHPHGSVLASDLSDTGIWLSETAYHLFNQAKIPSLDLALYTNSYAYHTHLDTWKSFDPSSLSHLHETVFHLSKDILSSPWSEMTTGQGTIFYDLLGFKTIYYSLTNIRYLHYLLGILSILFAYYTYSVEKASLPTPEPWIPPIVWLAQFLGAVLTLMGAILPTLLVVRIHRALSWDSMTWYRSIYHPILLFGPSSIFGIIFIQFLVSYGLSWLDAKAWTKPHMIERRNMIYGLIISGVLCWRMTTYQLASSFYFAWMWMAVASAILWILATSQRFKDRQPSVTFKGYFILWFVPGLLSTYYAVNMLASFIPLMGRVGPIVVDVTVGVLTGVLVAATMFPVVGLVHRWHIQSWSSATWTKLVFFCMFLPPLIFSRRFSFDKHHPQRIYIQERWNEDGRWLDIARSDAEIHSFYRHILPLKPVAQLVQDCLDPIVCVMERIDMEWKTRPEEKVREWDVLYPRSLFLHNLAIALDPLPPPSKPEISFNQRKNDTHTCVNMEIQHPDMWGMYISVGVDKIWWTLDQTWYSEDRMEGLWGAFSPRQVLKRSNGWKTWDWNLSFCYLNVEKVRVDVGGLIEYTGPKFEISSSVAPVYLSSVVSTVWV